MNQFYVGNNQEFIQAAYAPSGRAACKACKAKIQKQSIRLSYNITSGHFSSTNWYHLTCFELKPKFIDIDPEQEIYNIDQIDGNATDYDLVVDYIKAEKERLKKGVKKSIPAPPTSTTLQNKEENQDKPQEDKVEDKVEDKKESDDQAAKDDSDEDFKQGKKEQKKNKQQTKKQALKSVTSIYTPQQQKQFDELVLKYNRYSSQQLKHMLAINSQSKTGTKAEIVEKCADGKVLGRIPHCPNCGGGRPKFNKQAGTYKCSGYMDDDKFRNCNKTFKMEEMKREKWIE